MKKQAGKRKNSIRDFQQKYERNQRASGKSENDTPAIFHISDRGYRAETHNLRYTGINTTTNWDSKNFK